jgi:CheY-like chemotaxis protein
MTMAWNAAPGSHAVQFYDDERFLYRAIVPFCAEALRLGDPLIVIARRQTFEAVVGHLASERGCPLADVVNRIIFIDADRTLDELTVGARPDLGRFEERLSGLLADVRRSHEGRTIRVYGEVVDLLCRAGHREAAVRLEERWNALLALHPTSLLCGYAMEDFDEDLGARQLRAVCRQHTHVIPAEGFTDAPDDRTRFESVVLLQQRARTLDHVRADGPAAGAAPIIAATVYIVDDDASVRRSLARLLGSVDVRVQTFDSAEAFLAEVDDASDGCLIVDVQLVGMTGPTLLRRMTDAGWAMPMIAMSGSHDAQIERETLSLGACAFLRKPFDADVLIGAITRALS